MKNKFLAFLVAALAAVSLTGASAADKPIAFNIDGNTLHVYGTDGKEIGTGYSPGQTGQVVNATPYSFVVSFGADANGNLSFIVTPNATNPTGVNFTVNGRSVQMDKSSVVTVTVGSNGTQIAPGIGGGVKVDNQTTVAAQNTGGGTSTAQQASLPTATGTPTQQQPLETAAGTMKDDQNILLGPTPLPPQSPINNSQAAVAANNVTVQTGPTEATSPH